MCCPLVFEFSVGIWTWSDLLLFLFIWILGFPIEIFVNGKIETPLKLDCVVKVPVYER